jgi:3'-phosphoadenosine 5'-phosphosulfate (PAPS) 3'-phosphatase
VLLLYLVEDHSMALVEQQNLIDVLLKKEIAKNKDVVIRDWDIAPVFVLINEVGGIICDLNGKKIEFLGSFDNNNGLLVARDELLVKQVLKLVDMENIE